MISELVKKITVDRQVIDGIEKPIITVTYEFNDPISMYPEDIVIKKSAHLTVWVLNLFAG